MKEIVQVKDRRIKRKRGRTGVNNTKACTITDTNMLTATIGF